MIIEKRNKCMWMKNILRSNCHTGQKYAEKECVNEWMVQIRIDWFWFSLTNKNYSGQNWLKKVFWAFSASSAIKSFWINPFQFDIVTTTINWLVNFSVIYARKKVNNGHSSLTLVRSLAHSCDMSTNFCPKEYLSWRCLCNSHWYAIVNLWNIDFVCKSIAYGHGKCIACIRKKAKINTTARTVKWRMLHFFAQNMVKKCAYLALLLNNRTNQQTNSESVNSISSTYISLALAFLL